MLVNFEFDRYSFFTAKLKTSCLVFHDKQLKVCVFLCVSSHTHNHSHTWYYSPAALVDTSRGQTEKGDDLHVGDVCRSHLAADLHLYCNDTVRYEPIHLAVACCIRCVMQHCVSLVSGVLRCQLTAVLGDSFVLLPYLCAQCNSGTSHTYMLSTSPIFIH